MNNLSSLSIPNFYESLNNLMEEAKLLADNRLAALQKPGGIIDQYTDFFKSFIVHNKVYSYSIDKQQIKDVCKKQDFCDGYVGALSDYGIELWRISNGRVKPIVLEIRYNKSMHISDAEISAINIKAIVADNFHFASIDGRIRKLYESGSLKDKKLYIPDKMMEFCIMHLDKVNGHG